MLFYIINDPMVSAYNLNHDLDIIYQWGKMEFNPDPKKQASDVTLSCKKNETKPSTVSFQMGLL